MQQRKHGLLDAETLPREAVLQNVVLQSASALPDASQLARLAEQPLVAHLPKQREAVQQRKDGLPADATPVAEAQSVPPSAELPDAELPAEDPPRCSV